MTGSPFLVHVSGEPTIGGMEQEVIKRWADAEISQAGTVCEMNLKYPGKHDNFSGFLLYFYYIRQNINSSSV